MNVLPIGGLLIGDGAVSYGLLVGLRLPAETPFGLIVGDAKSFARCELATRARGALVTTVARSFPQRTFAVGAWPATMAQGEALTTCAKGGPEEGDTRG